MKKNIKVIFIVSSFLFLVNINLLVSKNYDSKKTQKRDYVIIKKGETLWSIAKKYNVSVEYLKRINDIKDIDEIKAGRRIYLKEAAQKESGEENKDYVIIKKGETLWRIAKRYNLSVEYLADINGIKDITNIKSGTKIYLRQKSNLAKKNYKKEDNNLNLSLKFPVNGKIIKYFNDGDNPIELKGIDFLTDKLGLVYAAESGVVKYANELRGYGNVIIIQFSPEISMVYAYLDKIYVNVGQNVEKGSVIGRVGKDYLMRQNVLHFKLLNEGRPVDPLKYFKYDLGG